ncbi:prothoracicotropic hormone [Nasonia vitripennis]|uniref:Prothoracicotropic hormone n=1 Tax=Nasonia vitripennis TaxID=7425 RepID=A0A7M7QAK2_NASVI|nr:prothoracicotropic hormone [Nasonia vitripennis]
MKLQTFLVLLLTVQHRAKGQLESYSDDFSDVELPTDERDDCSDGTCYAEKRIILPEKIVEHRQLMPRFATKLQSVNLAESFPQPQWRPVCGCVTQHKLVNLGEGHYPRYITTARCKSKTVANRFYQCKYYDYRVHVLVKRGLNSIPKNADELDVRDVEELPLPESLHANWQLFALSVSVACVAVERV